MPGVAAKHVAITNMNRRINQAGDWDQLLDPLLVSFSGTPSRYNYGWIDNPVDFEVWTHPL